MACTWSTRMPARTVSGRASRARGDWRARGARGARGGGCPFGWIEACARARVKSLERRGFGGENLRLANRARAGCEAREPGGGAREEEDVEGAGWMETLERDWEGGYWRVVIRGCVSRGKEDGRAAGRDGRRGAIDRCSMTGDECSI